MNDSDISVGRNSVDLTDLEENGESGESDVQVLILSISDLKEQEKVEKFFSEGCGCKIGPKKSQCSLQLYLRIWQQEGEQTAFSLRSMNWKWWKNHQQVIMYP